MEKDCTGALLWAAATDGSTPRGIRIDQEIRIESGMGICLRAPVRGGTNGCVHYTVGVKVLESPLLQVTCCLLTGTQLLGTRPS